MENVVTNGGVTENAKSMSMHMGWCNFSHIRRKDNKAPCPTLTQFKSVARWDHVEIFLCVSFVRIISKYSERKYLSE